MLTAEVSIYPLKTRDASSVIKKSISTLDQIQVDYTVDAIKTHITGTRDEVFHSLENMFDEAENRGGEISMVATITNAGQ